MDNVIVFDRAQLTNSVVERSVLLRPEITLQVLGEFRLSVDGQLLNLGPAAQKLLAMLACDENWVRRPSIAGSLWPDVPSSRAQANLRTTLHRLRTKCPTLLHIEGDYLQLCPHSVVVDYRTVLRAATCLLEKLGPHDQEMVARDLYRDLLPHWEDQWLTSFRLRYRQLRLDTLEALASRLSADGNFGAAVQAAMAAVEADELRDSAHRTLIAVHLAQGNRQAAMAHYARYVQILRDELGLDPPRDLDAVLWSA